MRTAFYTLLTIFLIVIFASSKAQTVNPAQDTVEWEYSKIENKVLSENVTMGGKFISYGSNSFRWIQNGVDREYTFENKSMKGDWVDATKEGELVYRSSCKDIDGTIRLFREKRKVFIVLDFVQPDKRTPHFVFEINSYAKLLRP